MDPDPFPPWVYGLFAVGILILAAWYLDGRDDWKR